MRNLFYVSIALTIVLVTNAAPECPAVNEEIVTLLPHESDCSKFYKCETGVAILYDCPATLHFNPTLSVCDWPEQDGCDGGSGPATESSTSSTSESTTQSTTESTNESTTTGGSGPGGPECPEEDGEFVTHFPHEDCTKFWKCDRGTAVEQDCPAGLHFNPTLLICDYPENAGCEAGSGGSSTDSSSASTTGGTTSSTTTGGSGSGGPECPEEDGEFVTHFPHEDCTKFWKCDRGTAVEQDCPAGLHFNPTLLVCDYPEGAGCEAGSGGSSTDSSTASTTEGTTSSTTTGSGSGGPECPEEDGEFVTHFPHEDCTKFWKCDRGTAVEQDCPAGLHFNPTLLVCDYPEDAGCEAGSSGSSSTTESTTQSTTEGTTESTTQSTTESTTEGTSPHPGDGYCETLACPELNGEYVYFVPIPGDCTRFCKCNWGKPYEFTCPAGLYFDTVENVCDYKENANCAM